MNFLRWALWLPSKILDYLVILAQAIYLPYFWLKVRRPSYPLILTPHQTLRDIKDQAAQDVPDQYGFVCGESHTLLQQAGFGFYIQAKQREALLEKVIYPNGSLYRSYPNDGTIAPSGDCLSSWVFYYTLHQAQRPDLVRRVATHYLKNCFGLEWVAAGGVSARSSNGGLAPIVDGWPRGKWWWPFNFGLSQPMTGPSFFTTQALLGLAKKELGGWWHLAYYAHWWIAGGWYYSLFPLVYFPQDGLYYTHHITALNLYSLNKNHGGYKRAMRWIAKDIAPGRNIQPWIGAAAWQVGVLSQSERQQAQDILCSMQNPIEWPQIDAGSAAITQGQAGCKNWSMMALCVFMLQQ